ncbi:MAG: NAD(+) synthase [Candidatus Aminicenantales bacterium]
MMAGVHFSREVLTIDGDREVARIALSIREALAKRLRRRGLILGISGGIDSSVTAALCARAIGKDKVIGLQMPERHSADETMALSSVVADHLGIRKVHWDISSLLDAAGFYTKYDEAVRSVIPKYGAGWKSKLVLPGIGEDKPYTLFSIVAVSPDGREIKKRLDLNSYLAIVAATNFKQRIRKMLEYYHADKHNYAVAGTPNRLEYDQGFFVKLGDGAADIKPIAHLYKTQVYQLARHLGLPEAVLRRPPTTDTYSLPQGQDEFYFTVPYEIMDLCLYGKNHGIDAETVSGHTGLSPQQVRSIYRDIERKRSTTLYLHLPPILAGAVPEIVT